MDNRSLEWDKINTVANYRKQKMNVAVITANNAVQTNDENRGGCKFVNKRLNGSMYKNRIFSVMFLPVTEAA